jgi:uncharacterized protein YijF (DUF1287 family)
VRRAAVLVFVAGLVSGTATARADLPPDSVRARVIRAAIERTTHRVVYDGAYRRIGYPNGDVPDSVGVCTDVVIRSYRASGIDLQQRVHEDMRRAFAAYPKQWGLAAPDPNIDHRRVPNLQKFLERQGAALPATRSEDDYLPGDLVTWMLPGNLPHIGIVVDRRSRDGARPMIVHNIGAGPVLEDVLFAWEMTGRYRWVGEERTHRGAP